MEATPLQKETQNIMKTFTVRESVSKGIQFDYKRNGPNEIFGLPVGQGIIHETKEECADAMEAKALIHFVDVIEDPAKNTVRIIKEQTSRDRRALLLIETEAGLNGEVKLFANTVTERLCPQRKRVVRDAQSIEQAVGVEVLADRPSALNESCREYLVIMEPGASFRITRSGHLAQGMPPELVVLWNGRWKDGAYNEDQRRLARNWGLSVYARRFRHGEM